MNSSRVTKKSVENMNQIVLGMRGEGGKGAAAGSTTTGPSLPGISHKVDGNPREEASSSQSPKRSARPTPSSLFSFLWGKRVHLQKWIRFGRYQSTGRRCVACMYPFNPCVSLKLANNGKVPLLRKASPEAKTIHACLHETEAVFASRNRISCPNKRLSAILALFSAGGPGKRAKVGRRRKTRA
ncbi:hypothetical protein BHE74_00032345 [Ensete ventricosum]|nr:hypothetical protein BHE74_00032345 [Ensete ventricosum]